jgi:hypothetical protein
MTYYYVYFYYLGLLPGVWIHDYEKGFNKFASSCETWDMKGFLNKVLRIYISIYPLLKSERLSVRTKLTL